jgi:short-subunit dehydrogenase
MAEPVTLITGASSGLGAVLAREFARHGHTLVLVARREERMADLAESIAQAGHKRPVVLSIDLGAPDAVIRIAEALAARGMEPDYIVNCAGFALLGSARSLDRSEQVAMVDLNVRVLTELSLAFIDSLHRHRGGILNVASVAGFAPGPGMAVYHATKAYVLSLSEALHSELKRQGIRVTALCPGPVTTTEFYSRAGIAPDQYPWFLSVSEQRVAREGYRALMKGRRLVVTGPANKIMTFLPRIAPRSAVLSAVRHFQSRRKRLPRSSA